MGWRPTLDALQTEWLAGSLMTNEIVPFKFVPDMLHTLGDALVSQYRLRQPEMDLLADTFGDPRRWAEFYIEPNCQQFNPADEEDESRALVRESLTSRLQHFLGGGITRSPHLLILADSGMGKSSALVMLKIAHLFKFWPVDYDVQLLKLGGDTLARLAVLPQRNTILLLDALDEDPNAFGRTSERLTEVLSATTKFHRVLITCRTQFFTANDDPFNRRGKVAVGGFHCPVIYLSLFDDEQVHHYLARRFPLDPARQKAALEVVRHMKSLRMRPMMLAHIEDLLENREQVWTLASIYRALVAAWLNRERSKIAQTRRPEQIPTNAQLLRACMQLARRMASRDVFTVSPTEVGSAISSDPEIRHIEHIDIEGRSLLNKNSEGQYRFAHLSIQEYLVALSVIINEPKLVGVASLKATALTLEFLSELIKEVAVKERALLPVYALLFESVTVADADWSYLLLSKARITNSIFDRVAFAEANFDMAVLEGVKFTSCSLVSTSLESAHFVGTKFSDSKMDGTSFSRSTLINVTFEKCVLEGAVFSEAKLRGCRFKHCRFQGVVLRRAEIESTDFEDCQFERTDIDSVSGNNQLFSSCTFLYCNGTLNREGSSKQFHLCEVLLSPT
jgi:uncharacterized protein YjbI with pentapeptide repeats